MPRIRGLPHHNRRPGDVFPLQPLPRLLAVTLISLAMAELTGCAAVNRVPPPPSPGDSVLAREILNGAMTSYWRSVLPRRPDLAIAVGRPAEPLRTPRDDIDDRQALMLARRIGEQLESVNAGALSPRDYASLQSLHWELESNAEASTYGVLDFSVISSTRSPLRRLLRVLLDHPFAAARDFDRYLYITEAASFWLIDVRDALDERSRRGALASADAVRDFSAFLTRLKSFEVIAALYVGDARLTSFDTSLVRAFREQEREAIELRVRPAIDSLLAYLQTYSAVAMPRPGLWQYAGGKEYYRHLLRRGLGVEITPEEAHRAGVSELRRLDSLLSRTRQRLGVSGSIAQFHDSLRRADRFAPLAMEAVRTRVTELLLQLGDTLPSRIANLPPGDLELRVASPLEALLAPEGDVRAPEYADSTARVLLTPFWGSTEAQLEGRSLVYRWIWPGAALAATMSYAGDSLSPVVLLHPAAATRRGWTEYGASLAGEMGLYSDPTETYLRLLHEAWNAALLLADTGIHYYGWSRQQALAVLRPYSMATDATLDSQFVALVVQAPGTAGGATIGQREHAAMRTWMQQLLGPAFDLKRWHAEVLSLGPVPLPVLATHLEWWGWNERRKLAESQQAIK